jgi:predicted amidophosphoribosyltransferase
VPASTSEHYCINDGSPMLEHCPSCDTEITSPYARFCAACGLEFSTSVKLIKEATPG